MVCSKATWVGHTRPHLHRHHRHHRHHPHPHVIACQLVNSSRASPQCRTVTCRARKQVHKIVSASTRKPTARVIEHLQVRDYLTVLLSPLPVLPFNRSVTRSRHGRHGPMIYNLCYIDIFCDIPSVCKLQVCAYYTPLHCRQPHAILVVTYSYRSHRPPLPSPPRLVLLISHLNHSTHTSSSLKSCIGTYTATLPSWFNQPVASTINPYAARNPLTSPHPPMPRPHHYHHPTRMYLYIQYDLQDYGRNHIALLYHHRYST